MNKNRLIERFMRYVKIDSVSKNEREFARHLEEELKTLGFTVDYDTAGEQIGGNCGNLIAKKKGNKPGAIFLCSHLDTVTPGLGIQPVLENDLIKSDGTTILAADDKAGIANIMEAVTYLIEEDQSYPDLEILFDISEEIGLIGSKYVDMANFSAEMGFVLDSGKPVGTIINQQPSECSMTFNVTGKPAHAGTEPEKGISALQIAARAIDRMKLLRIDAETTANIGVVQGGLATNIVMKDLTLEAEARSMNDDKLDQQVNHMVACFEEAATYYGGSVEADLHKTYKTYKVEENNPIVLKAKESYKALNIEVVMAPTGGGSDVNNFREKGMNCINLGLGYTGAHTLNEQIKVKDLETMTQFLIHMLQNW